VVGSGVSVWEMIVDATGAIVLSSITAKDFRYNESAKRIFSGNL